MSNATPAGERTHPQRRTAFVDNVAGLAGKTALVTGAGSGIGAAIARSLTRADVSVVLADIDAERLRAVQEELTCAGARVRSIAFDVSQLEGWNEALALANREFGGVDILCNNAGIGPARRSLVDLTDEDIDLILGVNLRGVLNGIRTIVPTMLADGRPGKVVNTASIMGHIPRAGIGDYVATKFAVVGISETLRAELQDSAVSVAVLCPALVETSLTKNSVAIRFDDPSAPHARTAAAHKSPYPGLRADTVGDLVVKSIVDDRFYIFSHPEYAEIFALRYDEITKAISSSQPLGAPDPIDYLGHSVLALNGRVPMA